LLIALFYFKVTIFDFIFILKGTLYFSNWTLYDISLLSIWNILEIFYNFYLLYFFYKHILQICTKYSHVIQTIHMSLGWRTNKIGRWDTICQSMYVHDLFFWNVFYILVFMQFPSNFWLFLLFQSVLCMLKVNKQSCCYKVQISIFLSRSLWRKYLKRV